LFLPGIRQNYPRREKEKGKIARWEFGSGGRKIAASVIMERGGEERRWDAGAKDRIGQKGGFAIESGREANKFRLRGLRGGEGGGGGGRRDSLEVARPRNKMG